MLITDVFRLATRMFRTNRSRTLLTILGISVGIGAILFLVSLGYGLQMMILNKITSDDALLSLDVTTVDATAMRLNNEALDNIQKTTGVDKVSPLVTIQSQMTIGDISSELSANFADTDFFRLENTTISEGRLYTNDPKDKNNIVISSAALQLFNLTPEEAFLKEIKFTLFLNRDEVRDESIIRDFIELEGNYRIIGIIEEEASSYVYMPLSVSRDLNIDDYSKIKVKVVAKDQLNTVRDAIIDKGFIVSALSDVIEQANQIFTIIQIILASFGVVALIVSAIGMFNTMTIALLERTQEIGIMKALGATSIDIWKMFLAESVIIGLFGGMGGILIGMLGGEAFNYGINVLAGAMGGEKIDMFFTPYWFTMTIITFSTVVGLITGFYPARRAANINPLEALRYK